MTTTTTTTTVSASVAHDAAAEQQPFDHYVTLNSKAHFSCWYPLTENEATAAALSGVVLVEGETFRCAHHVLPRRNVKRYTPEKASTLPVDTRVLVACRLDGAQRLSLWAARIVAHVDATSVRVRWRINTDDSVVSTTRLCMDFAESTELFETSRLFATARVVRNPAW